MKSDICDQSYITTNENYGSAIIVDLDSNMQCNDPFYHSTL